MELLDNPAEVIDSKFLKYLSWNDMLRLRRVCQATLRITNGYLRVHPIRAPEIEINFKTDKTFAAFLAMDIPTTKIFLNNPFGYHFYEDEDESRRQFLARYGSLIKHLRVTQLIMWPTGNELEFLNSLVNLQTFKASHFGWSRENGSSQQQQRLLEQQATGNWRIFQDAFPRSFKNLESIRVGENPENGAINKLKVTGEIFLHCQKLKKAALPFTFANSLPPPNVRHVNGTLWGEIHFLGMYMEPRPSDVYSEQGRLELYDFINYHDKLGSWEEWKIMPIVPVLWFCSIDFMPLLETAVKTGLKFANVSPYWFIARDAQNGRYAGKEFGAPVVSLRGLDPSMMTMDMPNLEKTVIPYTSRCVASAAWDEEGRPEWPMLKILEKNVDGDISSAFSFEGFQDLPPYSMKQMMVLNRLWESLFKDVVRVNLTELKLTFEEEGGRRESMIKVTVLKIEDIVKSCPNLKKIKIGNWPGKNKQLLKLWEGLPRLEEVEFEGCKEVGNVTFVGEEREKPEFFKLENLKKLTLNGLDKMPKITDLLFEMVLAKMNLKELVITSDKPVEKVTKKGIDALLEGPFAETIGKFSFRGWSMAGVSDEEFQDIGKKFRSYNMI